MANNISKTVTIFIDGKQVDATLKTLQAELKKLRNQQRNATIGSKEYIETSLRMREIEAVIDSQKKAYADLGKEASEAQNKIVSQTENLIKKSKNAFSILSNISQKLGVPLGNVDTWIQSAASLSDAMAAVQKTTGLSADEVQQLQERLLQIDTRSSRGALNQLAAEAGKLGITGVDNVAGFVAAADKINVALGDELGEGAMVAIGKLTNLFASSTSQLKDLDIEHRLLAIGSAVNSLGAASAASEGDMVNFMQRLGGVASQAGMSADQVLGYASVLSASGTSMEVAATSLQRVIGQMFRKPADFARAAGMEVRQFTQLCQQDMNAALQALLAGLNSAGGMDQLTPVLDKLGLKGSGAVDVLSLLKSRLADIDTAQQIASSQLASGSSIIDEFNTVNQTAAARLEKLQNRMEEVRASLGEALLPYFETGASAVVAFSNTIAHNRSILSALTGVISGLVVAKVALAIQQAKTNILATRDNILQARQNLLAAQNTLHHKQNRVARLENYKMQLQQIVAHEQELTAQGKQNLVMMAKTRLTTIDTTIQQANTAATQAHTAAERARAAAMAATPWGAVLAVAGALVGVIYSLVKNSNNASSATGQLAKEMHSEQQQAKQLFENLAKAREGSDEYRQTLEELKSKYPEIIQKHTDESGVLRDLKTAYDEVTTAIRQQVTERVRAQQLQQSEEKFGEVIEEEYNDVYKIMAKFLKKIGRSSELNDLFATVIRPQLDAVADGSKDAIHAVQAMSQQLGVAYKDLAVAATSIFGIPLYEHVYNITKAQKKLAEQTAQTNAQLQQQNAITPDPKSDNSDNSDNSDKSTTTTDPAAAQKKRQDALRQTQDLADQLRAKELQGIDREIAAIDRRYEEQRSRLLEAYGLSAQQADRLPADAATALQDLSDAATTARHAVIDNLLQKAQQELDRFIAKNQPAAAAANQFTQQWDQASARFQQQMAQMDAAMDNYLAEADRIEQQDAAAANQLRQKVAQYRELRAEMEATARQEAIDASASSTQSVTLDDRYAHPSSGNKEDDERLKKLREINRARDAEQAKLAEAYRAERDIIEALETERAATTDPAKAAALQTRINQHQAAADTLRQQSEQVDAIAQKERELANSNAAKAHFESLMESFKGFAEKSVELFSAISSIMSNIGKRELQELKDQQEARTKSLDDQLAHNLISEAAYNAEKEKMQEEYDKRERELELENFERQRVVSVAQASINGAAAVVRALADLGPIAGPIAAGLIGAITAAQIAAILSEPAPYARGGYVRQRTVYQAGEAGPEWVASSQLLQDPATAPLIAALEDYQRGRRRSLSQLLEPMAAADLDADALAPSRLSATLAAQRLATASSTASSAAADLTSSSLNDLTTTARQQAAATQAQTTLLADLADYLSDPANRQAVIIRHQQQLFEEQERFLRDRAIYRKR